jgi:hypothetical protein
MHRKPNRNERLRITLAGDELKAIDDFRFRNRMPSRGAEVREAMRRGLIVADFDQSLDGRRSADFVVGTGQPRRAPDRKGR